MDRKNGAVKAMVVVFLAIFLCISAGGNLWRGDRIQEEPEKFEWFSTISYWKPPEWSLQEDTITGQITRATGAAFTYTIPQKNADMQLSQRLARNELPDVMTVSSTVMQKQLVESEKVWNMEELLKTYDPDSHLLKQFPKDIRKILETSEGGWYGYPSHMGSADARRLYPPCDDYYWDLVYYQYNEGIMFNRAIMDKLGLTIEDLRTEGQVLDVFERVRKLGIQTGQDLIPILLNGKKYESISMVALGKSFGAKWVDEDGSYRDYYYADQTKQAMRFLNECYRAGCLEPRQLTYEVEEMQEQLRSGKVFCFIGNLADAGVDERDWEGGVILSSQGDNPAAMVSMQAQAWLHTYISKSCRNPEKIAKWLSFMTSQEGMLLNYLGIPGRDSFLTDHMPLKTGEGEGELAKGRWTFWAFANTAWEKSVELPPDADSRQAAADRVQTAMGRYEKSELYEVALINNLNGDLGAEGAHGERVSQINEYKQNQLLSVIIAESEGQFEDEYRNLIQGLDRLGLRELDKELGSCYRKRCERYGITLEDNYRDTILEGR